MLDRALTAAIKAETLNNGMDLVGFGPVDRWDDAPFLLSPQAIMPDSKTVVVAAIHITDTWTEMGGEPEPQDRSPGGWMDQNSLLDRIAYRVVRLLSDHGHKAIAVASSNIWRYREFEGIPSLFAPDLSHMHAAAAAGLAEIGWSGLAITPEFGARCRFISIVTNAELVPTPMYDGPKLCDMCMECVKHCPTAAMKKDMNSKTPHVVKIGGKTFKYANKNMWRCAWAEHFELDLNSENLKKWDHIDESKILEEVRLNGRRGHERGVCQKVCVPPHLRTDKPSFGRSDKQIAQNRINRRYPESMPTLRKIRDDIIADAVRMGVDLTAVGPLDGDIQTDANYTIQKEFPGAKTVIAFAARLPVNMNLPKECRDTETEPVTYAAYNNMHHILLRISRKVEDYGYHAASYTGRPLQATPIDKLAAMAGLGTLDGDGRLTTSEYGEGVVVGAIVTDAPIDSTPNLEASADTSVVRTLTPKRLRGELENTAHANLTSLFGVAPLSVFDNIVADLKANVDESHLGEKVIDTNEDYHGIWVPEIVRDNAGIRHPSDILNNSRSVIVLGMHFPRTLIENSGLHETQQIGTYAFHQYQTCFELRYAAYQVARRLMKHGHKTIISEDLLGVGSQVDSHRGMLPDARSNAIEAVAAGLGQLGKSGALLTPEFGPHQRLIAIITDAELPADSVYSGPTICRDCNTCVSKCSMNAIGDESFSIRVNGTVALCPTIDRHRCDWSKRYALCRDEGPALIGNKTDVAMPEGDITIETISEGCKGRDPIMKRRPCILESCLRYCPAG